MKRRETVCVAMSGGVDSSVVAAILKRRGHDVVGVTLQIWQESQRDPRHAGCCSLGAVEDARRVARLLDIPHYVVNYKDTFKAAVIDEFIDEYAAGRTPNPCVTCNNKVKFGPLLAQARDLGCTSLATGHYARVRRTPGGTRLLRARATAKDQSYVLAMLDRALLEHLLFPLGELPGKHETRRLAAELGLPVADKPDSQEICFVNDAGGYREFLRKARPELAVAGTMVRRDGQVVGRHQGVIDYTVGQRRGLGVSDRSGKPLYVLQVDGPSGRVVVGFDEELACRRVRLGQLVWHTEPRPLRVSAKIRANMEPRAARLVPGEPNVLLFDEPVRAVTPGQVAVAYTGQTVVAAGRIEGGES